MKRIGWLIVISASAVAGMLYYFWYQATALPSWYRDRANAAQSITLSDPASLQQARQRISAKLRATELEPDGSQEIYLTEQDLNALAATEIDNLTRRSRLRDAIQAVHSVIQDGRVESGAVVNMANVPNEALGPRERELVSWLRESFPSLFEREVYIGVEGKPAIVNGQLQFDDSLRVKIGNLRLTLTDVANRLGISEETLWQKLTQALGALQVKDVEVADDQLRLRGSI